MSQSQFKPATNAELKTAVDAVIAETWGGDDISIWDTSLMTNMDMMFAGASTFNKDISQWDVSNVTSMGYMFTDASTFNGDISGWDVSKVTDMILMFYNAPLFNQDIRVWSVGSGVNLNSMFTNATAMHDTYTGSSGFSDTPTSAFFNLVNNIPVANADNATTNEDTPILINVLANDTDADANDTLTVTAASATNGTIEIQSDFNLLYTPNSNYNGTDTISYTVSDGISSTIGTASVIVNEVNDVPLAVSFSVEMNEDGNHNLLSDIATRISDIEDILTVSAITVTQSPTLGAIDFSTGVYTPTANVIGTDIVKYTVSDSEGLSSSEETVTITITPVYNAPVPSDFAVTMDEDTDIIIDVTSHVLNVDNVPLTMLVIYPPANGTISDLSGMTFKYTPNANYNGVEGFRYTITDSTNVRLEAIITVNVTPVNDVPARNTHYIISETNFDDQTFGNFTNQSDDDLDWIIHSGWTPSPGTGPGWDFPTVDKHYAYIEASFNGHPSKTANLVGKFNLSTDSTLHFVYHMWAATPVEETVIWGQPGGGWAGDGVQYNESDDQTFKVFVKYSETDDYTEIYNAIGNQGNQWNNVSLDISSGENVYIKFSGTTSSTVDYTDADGNNMNTGGWQSDIAIDYIRFKAPITESTSISYYGNPVTIDVLANYTDADGDALAVSASSTTDGSVVINTDNTLEFTPKSDFFGTHIVSYTISDGQGGTINGEVAVVSEICLVAGTQVLTDQGYIAIEALDVSLHTIDKQRIVAIARTVNTSPYLICVKKSALGENVPSQDTIMSKDHMVDYKGGMLNANRLEHADTNVHKVDNQKTVLYNVLLESYLKMTVNNMVVETLHSENTVAKMIIFDSQLPAHKRELITE